MGSRVDRGEDKVKDGVNHVDHDGQGGTIDIGASVDRRETGPANPFNKVTRTAVPNIQDAKFPVDEMPPNVQPCDEQLFQRVKPSMRVSRRIS